MSDNNATAATPLRLAEIVAALSLATDMGTGVPFESMLRVALMSVHLAGAHTVSESELVTCYYLPLLALSGCTANAPSTAAMLGDETSPEMVDDWMTTDFGKPREAMGFMFRTCARGKPPLTRAASMFSMVATGGKPLAEIDTAHCEVAERVSERLGFGEDIRKSIWHVYERWDGRGVPNKVKGEVLTMPARILHISMDIVYAYMSAGPDAAFAMVRHKAGTKYDPALVETFVHNAGRLLSVLEVDSAWDAVLKAEPGPRPCVTEEQVDSAAKAIADFADLKTPFMSGHSTAVAELAAAAARRCRLAEADVKAVYRAGLVHDVGRVGVTAAIWCKASALTESEWERVRLYTYFTERVLARPKGLAPLGTLAALHRERLDGSGYHKGLPAALLPATARILAAADTYRAMTEPRPYRPALSPDEAAAELKKEVRAGHLDGDAVNAVLAEAGHSVRIARPERPAGLTDREIEVLRLMGRGLPVQEMAGSLVVSRKTLDNHIQHSYNKIGVTTRAAATFFAMENNLLD
jgi:HD-GYP domain-containing protein (c-di-GMP phosphodiesterase class II)/DNA-binding CsgD family transcriptional regulator